MPGELIRLTQLSLATLGQSLCPVRRLEPVTFGVPFPRGCLREPLTLALLDGDGRRAPLQVQVLDHWPDGSIRWALLSFQASTSTNAGDHYILAADPTPQAPPPGATVEVSTVGLETIVDTGVLRVVLKPHRTFPFGAVLSSGRQALDCERSGFRLADRNARPRHLHVTKVTVEDARHLRTTVAVEGVIPSVDGALGLAVWIRLHFHAGSAAVRFDVIVRNPEPARHPGGIWTLGAGGSVRFRELALDLVLPGPPENCEVLCSAEAGVPLQRCDGRLELYQESSGGPNWRNHNHVNRDGVVPFSLKGYRLRAASGESSGLRATPIVVLRDAERALSVATRHFWQNFPKGLTAGNRTITVSLFPAEFPDLHEIQGGEQKTHTFWVAFGPDRTTDVPLEWCRAPLLAHTTPEWYAAAAAMPYLTPAAEDPNTDYLCLVNEAIDGNDTFEQKREVIDEYGWRNFGDLYADHEAVLDSGQEALVSHYNNQYDAVAGFACQFLRSGSPRWWTQMDELARHVTDIDIYHTDRDKAAFNGGLFWHTYHYVDAGGSTHRAYPRSPGVNGGGPANEHNYTTGVMLHHFLTGDPTSRDAVVGLADWVLNMDDGGKSIFRWLARGYTGLASSTASTVYHGPGRGAGNSVNALLDAHRLTGERRYIEKAEQLIRRCIHPADDVAARELLDSERRWSYTVFLRALGKYLEHKNERNELDVMYVYARESLLHYARWMALNERPYLDCPEILEYPTETWPALDMKKSEAFMVASRHAEGQERLRFLERADFFFRSSTSALRGFKTRTKARPLVLMLSHGFMWAWFRRAPDAPLPAPVGQPLQFGVPERFVPQKVRAMRRAIGISVVAAALVFAALMTALLR